MQSTTFCFLCTQPLPYHVLLLHWEIDHGHPYNPDLVQPQVLSLHQQQQQQQMEFYEAYVSTARWRHYETQERKAAEKKKEKEREKTVLG
ncbi:hypothetical protein FKW77_002208 [Venturia effusa]|uniref:Uncharacterized protein n=1 Tax=Venturia effusa TaxID=50376 RepID=A0A517LMJ1_9PEZI|nr:hypothetical protein FKW77_002208 [Venturia effusa]